MSTLETISRGSPVSTKGSAMLKKFFKVLGIFALTIVGLFVILAMYVAEIDARVPVDLLSEGKVYVDQWDQGYVSAKGTWVSDEEGNVDPLNMSDITCLRDQKLCFVAEASIIDLHGKYLKADGSFADIKRWDSSALEYQTDAICVSYIYVIDRATQKLIGRRVKKANAKEELCGLADNPLLRPRETAVQQDVGAARHPASKIITTEKHPCVGKLPAQRFCFLR